MSGPRDRDERGAVAVVVSVFALVMVLLAAFAVDLGMQRVARRDMQSLADIVALDLVRELDGRKVEELSPLMPGLAAESLERNEGTLGDEPQLQVDLGELDADGDFVEMTEDVDVPTAVRVFADTAVGFAFFPGRGGAGRSAVADIDSGACFKLGSVGAGLDTKRSALLNSLIGEALGSNVNLSLVSYQGLANAGISLADLVDISSLGVGSVDELLTTEMSLADLYNASATVLDNQGHTAQADIFQALALSVGPIPKVTLGELISAQTGNGAAADATVNALDLLYGSAMLSNGDSFVEVNGLGINLGITTLTGSVRVGQPAKMGCGRVDKAVASTQQVETNLDGNIASLPGVSALGINVTSTAVTIQDLIVSAASAEGTLKSAQCGTPSAADPDKISVFATPGLVTIDGTLSIKLGATVQLPLGLLGSLVLVGLEITIPAVIDASSSASGQLVAMEFPNLASYDTGHPAGSAGIGLSSSAIYLDTAHTTVKATLAGLPINLGSLLAGVVNSAASILGSLTTSLNTNLILPLLNTLGVRLASADVYGVPRPLCGEPALRG